jgi:hypothetical protein
MDRRAFLQASVAAALMSRWAGAHADDLAAYKPAVPGRPAPKPSRFGKTSTAEDVTAGMDLSGKTALVTGCNSGLGPKRCACLELSGVFASSN